MTTLTKALVVQATPVEPLDTVELFAGSAETDRYLWIDPESGRQVVGLGCAREFTYEGADRFASAADHLAALNDGMQLRTDLQPVLFAGFSFAHTSHDERDPSWRGFAAGHLVLPELTYLADAAGAWMLSALPTGQADRHDSLVQTAIASVTAVGRPSLLGPEALDRVAQDRGYVELVARARDEVAGNGDMDKVVAARRAVVDIDVNVPALLDALRKRHLQCATFAFAHGDRVFLGASPERLVEVHDQKLLTDALAGTVARGVTPDEDDALAAQLANDPKEANEHEHVIRAITRALANAGVTEVVVEETQVVRLAALQHLRTDIRATMTEDLNILDVVGALHPTPAVAGVPAADAMDWLHNNETFDRGWYTGPVGVVGCDGSGEFRVALRSALVEPGRMHLFAGAGIVPRSDPDRELVETTVKARAILDSLLQS